MKEPHRVIHKKDVHDEFVCGGDRSELHDDLVR